MQKNQTERLPAEDDMPPEIDFSRGVRGKYSQVRRDLERYREALERIRAAGMGQGDPQEAVRKMRDYAEEALAS
jgi:hypothetical protein